MLKALSPAIFFAAGSLAMSPVFAQSLKDAVEAEMVYTSDLLRNTSGGVETGTRYLQNLDLAAAVDVEKLFGKGRGELFIYALYNNDATFSDLVGDLQVVSNIDADQGWRLYELWWDGSLTDSLDLRAGLYDLNSEFDAAETAGNFISSSHGIGPDFSQSGQNGPSIFPSTSAAVRLQWSPKDSIVLRYALLDAVPGDLDDPKAFVSAKISGDEGVLQVLEIENTYRNGLRAAVGAWKYSADFERINNFVGGQPTTGRGNHGIYSIVDAPIYENAGGTRITAFARFGIANQKYNQLSSYAGFGAVMNGMFAARPDDSIGLAVASAFNGGDYKDLNNQMVNDKEVAVELTYSTQLNKYLRIQPDIQYVINPGTDLALDNALILGVRFELGIRTP